MKKCNKCLMEKSHISFFKDKGSKDGLYSICKECKQNSTMQWRDRNRTKYNDGASKWRRHNTEKTYGFEIKRRYGCDLEQYNSMLIKQNGKCFICLALHNPAIKKGRLFVDHDHKTTKIRALLCSSCNCMLGYAKDKKEVLQSAINYLKMFEENKEGSK